MLFGTFVGVFCALVVYTVTSGSDVLVTTEQENKTNLPVGTTLTMELLLMKARIAFYFAAVVALVLFLAAAVPSHATQHRDPALTPPEMVQKPATAPRTDTPAIKPRKSGNSSTDAKTKRSAKKASQNPMKSGSDAQSHTGSMGTM